MFSYTLFLSFIKQHNFLQHFPGTQLRKKATPDRRVLALTAGLAATRLTPAAAASHIPTLLLPTKLEQLSLSNAILELVKFVTSSSHDSNRLTTEERFVEEQGIEGLHFKSTEHLFAAQ